MIEWLETYKKENITLFMVTHDRFFLERVCNEIIELDNGKLYSYKGNYLLFREKEERIASENSSVDTSAKSIRKRIRMDATSTESENNKIKIASGRFYEIKDKAQSRRKENKVELEINMERMGSIIELHKISKKFKDHVIMDNFSYDFQPGERIGIIGKMERENQPFKFID
jgi:ATP-binding cassette subfamily F protein uup